MRLVPGPTPADSWPISLPPAACWWFCGRSGARNTATAAAERAGLFAATVEHEQKQYGSVLLSIIVGKV